MRDHDDLPVWDSDALRRFTTHAARTVRDWAYARLAASHDAAHVPFLLERLPTADAYDATCVVGALREIAPRSFGPEQVLVLEAFERSLDAGHDNAKLARKVLARAGDAGALGRLAARCAAGAADRWEWELVYELDPARCRALHRDGGWIDDPADAPAAALPTLAWVCDAEVLPRVHEQALRTLKLPEGVAWEVLMRCHAERCPLVDGQQHTRARACAEELATELAARRSPADRALSARWESVDALRPLADAMVNHRLGEAVAWCRTRLDTLRRNDDASACARAYAEWLSRQRKPELEMVQAVGSMAFAAVDRALDALKPFDKADPETRAMRTLATCARDAAPRRQWAIGQWGDPAGREVIERAVSLGLASVDDAVRIGTTRLAEHLPGFELPAAVGDPTGLIEFRRVKLACLRAHPASAERLARENNAAAAPRALLYDALAEQNRRAASDVLRGALGRLAGGTADLRESVLTAVEDVGDPALLATVIDVCEPNHDEFGPTLRDLAYLAPGEEWSSPEVVEALATYERAEAGEIDDPPRDFVVRFRCDACGADGRVAVPQGKVRAEQRECRGQGWDGVSFNRVIGCATCGAEDQYTLSEGTRWRALMSLYSAGDGFDVYVGALAVEGVKGRRASELLQHFAQAAEAAPDDVDAWRRLAVAQRLLGKSDAVAATLQRAAALEGGDLGAAVRLHATLAEHGDAALVARSARRLLTLLPRGGDPDTRKMAAKKVVEHLRNDTGEVLTVTWREGSAEVTHAVALDRVLKWERLAMVLHDPSVRSMALGGARPEEGGRLEKVIEGLIAVPDMLKPQAATRPNPKAVAELEARYQAAGRNDPCPCGSGKKYKKCHLNQP
jgi:hypothetical protein